MKRFQYVLFFAALSLSIAARGGGIPPCDTPEPSSPCAQTITARNPTRVAPTLVAVPMRTVPPITTASAIATFAAITTQAPAPIPPEYQSLYTYLDSKLDEFDKQLNAQPKTESRDITFAAELIIANGNRGEELLQPQTFQAVQLYLDRLQSLSVRGVKVAIKYPLLTPDFPRSSEYLAFYKKVAQELKRRNMKMLAGTGAAFTQPEFSSVKVNYRGMTLEKLKQGEREQVVTIIRELQPDYVTVANEPSTQTELTGVRFGVRDYTDFVNFVLNGLDRRGVLVGAGSGNWDDVAYIESLAKNTSVDYIDIHLYPINREFTRRAIQQADVARTNGKRLIIGENWLYKSGENERGGASAVNIMARDVYNFWQRLDEKFLTLVVQFARIKQIEFVSPFWSKYFFAYADYAKVKRGASNGEILRAADAEMVKNVLAGTFSGIRVTYKKLAGN